MDKIDVDEPLLKPQEGHGSLEMNSVPLESDSCVSTEPLLPMQMDGDNMELTPIETPEEEEEGDPENIATDNISITVRPSSHGSNNEEDPSVSEHSNAVNNGANPPYDEVYGRIELHRAAGNGDLSCVKEVFSRRSGEINTADPQGYSPLHIAAKSGNRSIINFLMQNGATVDAKGCKDGMTPLHMAIVNGNFDAAKCLIESGADATSKDNNGCTSLHFASANGFHEFLQYILDMEGAAGLLNSPDNDKKTPLHHAVHCGCIEAVQLLLDKNADIRAVDSSGNTVLHIAAAGNYPDLITLMIDIDLHMQGNTESFVNQLNLHQATALEIASLYGSVEAANVLIRIKKVKTIFMTIDGNKTIDMKVIYPLHRAAASGDQSVLQHFVERKLPIDMKDINGFTPLMVAVRNGQEDAVRYMIENGANVQLRDFSLKTCLSIAVEMNEIGILCLLVQHCKEYLVNDRDKDFMSPLHYAAKEGNEEALKVLLDRASYIAVDHQGKSPIHYAAEFGSLACVRLLKEAQLDIDLQGNDDEMSAPICFAAKEGHTDVCKYLIENGSKIKSLLSAPHEVFVNIFKQMIESTTINPEEEDGITRPRFESVRGEIDCLDTLLTIDRKGNEYWINRTIRSLKEEVCAVFDEHQHKEGRRNKLVEMLETDITMNDGESEKVIMGKLIQYAPNIAEYALDKSITSCPGTLKKTYNFGLLDIRHTDANIDEPFFGPDTMQRHNRRQLLKHPVTLRLLKSKWARLGLVVYLLSTFIYMIFLTLVTTMVVLDKQTEQNLTDVRGRSLFEPTFTSMAVPWLTLMLCIAQIMKEAVRVYFMKALYFQQIETLTELLTYLATLVFMVPFLMESSKTLSHEIKQLQYFKWQAGALAILFAWITFLLYLKRIPAIGTYVWMFEEVVKTVLRVLLGLFFLLVAFGFSFYVLLKNQTSFRTYPRSFMKTVMWTFGEFEYDDVFVNNPVKHDSLTMIIFMVFLIVMPILTMNLLVGLAVGDIEQVRQSAFERNFENQVKILDAFNETYPRWILKKLYIPFVEDDPNTVTLKERFVEWFIDLEKSKPDRSEMEMIQIRNMITKELGEMEVAYSFSSSSIDTVGD